MQKEEILKELETLDGRSKRAKELREQLEKIEEIQAEMESQMVIDDPDRELVHEELAEPLLSEADIKEEEIADDYVVSDEVYEKIDSWYGKVPRHDLKWLFKTYNEIFGQKIEVCLCTGKVRRMIAKLTKTYERERA